MPSPPMNDIYNYIDQLGTVDFLRIDQKKNQRTVLPTRIWEILTRSKLRLGPLDQETEKMLRGKIELSMRKGAPITLILAVGGFKGIGIASSPHINWAEVFHIDFLVKMLGEIALIYKPGLRVEFSGDDVALPFMNNYPEEWTKCYNQEFDKLLEIISEKLPDNIFLSNRPASSFYLRERLETEIEEEVSKMKLPEEIIEQKFKHAMNNFVWKGEKDWRGLSEKEKMRKLRRSVLVHDAWLNVDYRHRREYLEGGVNIPIIHKRGMAGCYGIRSTASSDVQFWEAEGYLTVLNGHFSQRYRSINSVSPRVRKEEIKSKFEQIETLRMIELGE